MNNFKELLGKIRKRPPLYLNKNSIFAFQSFYNGYRLAKAQASLQDTKQELQFAKFLNWVKQKYASSTNIELSWAMLVFIHSVDERDALKKLFSLFDEYLGKQEDNQANEE
ncbi:MAG: hypothetical protein GDA44_02520 [Prochloron sp. SP5CPC1]|nr:hypothetical protein [Candidatus Paraprochloron terpiosi SP5CPC1]